MLPMPLPDIRPGTATALSDSASCKRWIQQLPLTNSAQVQQVVTSELKRYLQFKAGPLERLRTLEELRDTVELIQTECAKKYATKPVPLIAAETALWNQVVELWHTLQAAYQRCLEDAVEGGGEARKNAALICQRCIRYTTLSILEHYLTNQEVVPDLWRHLHALYVFAEKHGLADTEVQDNLNRDGNSTSCTAAYAQALLLGLGNPYSLTPKQLELAKRWLEKWGGRISIITAPSEGAFVIAVDLDGNQGVRPWLQEGTPASARYLVVDDLAKHLLKRIVLLEKGQPPADLGLGADCTQPGCETLLKLLYQQWCKPGSGAVNPRHQTEYIQQVCVGIAAIHYFVTGKPFKQPGAHQLSRQEEEELATFGHLSKQREEMRASQMGYTLESWKTINQGPQGFGLVRAPDSGGSRLHLHQLIGTCPAGGKIFLLCVVQWLTLKQNGELHIGARALPGVPEPVAVRPIGGGISPPYVQAFLMPDVADQKIEPSLILPGGLYQTGRVIEVFTSEPQRVKLTRLMEKGIDYEQIDFSSA
jgi:cyclic-di-GMP-binding protein